MTVTVNEISPQPRVVIIAVDDSIHSYHAVTWAKLNAVQASDKVHLITVHIPNDYPPSIAGEYHIKSVCNIGTGFLRIFEFTGSLRVVNVKVVLDVLGLGDTFLNPTF